MAGNINNSALISTSRAMAGDTGSGREKGAAQNIDNQNPGFNITDSVEKSSSGDVTLLLKEIESLKRQLAESQASSGKEQSNKPEAAGTKVKRSGFSAFAGFVSGKIEEMKISSEKREAEREAALRKEREERDAAEAAILEKERAEKDAALQKEKDKAMAELQFRGKEGVREASEDLIIISESLRPKESLREATITFILLKYFHHEDRTSAIKTYKYICATIGDNDKKLDYTKNMLRKMDNYTYEFECSKLLQFYEN